MTDLCNLVNCIVAQYLINRPYKSKRHTIYLEKSTVSLKDPAGSISFFDESEGG